MCCLGHLQAGEWTIEEIRVLGNALLEAIYAMLEKNREVVVGLRSGGLKIVKSLKLGHL